ncbi:Predicted PurR-regulated permease PerM [Paracoccus alcaliphilus]|uniref:Predicted PurR-regulated permease PerM n=1 Tax=Paracoccus alcaliphilus TaxID=34002 RepID=A0A1H8KMV4_9RHOB|nr:AI-2E family transporter [Paracoccus alcaliphilus]WCR17310.1 AI-2E family transporter [Paracoccus alcaliphilus]SEN94300.1 Predicted PurR-regulated permease PerM [Paracoccus alcaliphilus]
MRMPVQKQLVWWGVATAILLVAMWLLGQPILPFIMGAGIAYLLDPVADRLERMGLSRIMSVVVITAGAIILLAALILLVMPLLLRQAAALINTAPQMFDQAMSFISARFPDLVPENSSLGTTLSDLGSTFGEQMGSIATTVIGSVGGVISTIALLVIAPVVAFYLLLDWDHMVEEIDRLLPREHAPTIRRIARAIDEALSGFVRGQGLVILILGTWYSIGLMLVGLPFGFFIGIMAAVLSFIPYVGVLIGGATAIGVALFSFWGDPLWIGAVVTIFAIGQIVEGNYLQPKIVGGHVGLHPVWLLLALSVFGSLFGFVGMVVAVPLAAALGVIARFLIERYRSSALYTGQEVPHEPAQPTLIEIVPPGTVADNMRKARLAADRGRAISEIETMQEDLRRKEDP